MELCINLNKELGLPNYNIIMVNTMVAFQIIAGWLTGQPAVGGVVTAHMKPSDATI